jgi:hypothetical protein
LRMRLMVVFFVENCPTVDIAVVEGEYKEYRIG